LCRGRGVGKISIFKGKGKTVERSEGKEIYSKKEGGIECTERKRKRFEEVKLKMIKR
jgi:hypothetical protein